MLRKDRSRGESGGSGSPDTRLETNSLIATPVADLEVIRLSSRCEILCLGLPEDAMEIRFYRWTPDEAVATASFRLAPATGGLITDDGMGTMLTQGEDDSKPLLWLPPAMVVGRMDTEGRLVESADATVESWWEIDGEHTLHLRLRAQEQSTVLWPMVVFSEETSFVAKEIFDLGSIESQTYVKSDWFHASSPADLWRYFIDGGVFDPRDDGRGRFRCQQCAMAWWNYLDTMYHRTGKGLYRTLARAVAWSVCFDLEPSGAWLHGFWHQEPEIHSRMLWDGVHLLLSEFETEPHTDLLAAAEQVVTFAIENLTEDLHETGLWFLHDSVEDTRPLHVSDPVLGRSETNSFCLNTHIQALCVLARIRGLGATNDRRFEDEYRRGMKALDAVLGLEFGSGPLRLMDHFLPQLLACKVPHGLGERVVRFVVYRVLARAYWWARRHTQGLVFPSGYLDRDLGLTMLADEYHVVNLKDLVELERLDPQSWLRAIIDGAVLFTSTLDFRRSMERSPIWAEWADVVEVLGPVAGVDQSAVAAQVRIAMGGETLDSFSAASRLSGVDGT